MHQGSLQSVDSNCKGRTGCNKTGVRMKGTMARVRGVGAEPVQLPVVSSSVGVHRETMAAARRTRMSTITGSCTRSCLVNNVC